MDPHFPAEPPAVVEHFLSVYMEAPDITALTVQRHDHCAALWRREGDVITLQRYWEFERVTGLKHHRLPLREADDARAFLDVLLAEEGLSLDDMAEVWGTPHLETDRGFAGRQVGKGQSVHSTSHLFSAIGMDWRLLREGRILGLALDAGPDLQLDEELPESIYSGCVVDRGTITTFPVESPAPLWMLARGRFKQEEGTLMALSSATTCTVDFNVESLVATLPFWTQAEVFHSSDVLLDRLVDVVTAALATPEGRAVARYDDRFDHGENLRGAVMKLVDRASWVVVDRNIEHIREEHGLDLTGMHLAICGGFALNCPNNTRLMNKYGFASLSAPPCANDGGQALGLGIMALHDRGLTGRSDFRLADAFHGREIRDLDRALEEFGAVVDDVSPLDLEQVCTDLVDHPIAWVQGRAEIGPRALGHRSLLGDPRSARTKDILNDVKLRQWWRPVAPIVLEEHVGEWFRENRSSPYMLEVFASRDEVRSAIPAVLHLDGTARIQTVGPDDDPVLRRLLTAFHHRTGVPILANTSLNDKGEPLVDTAAQVLNFCVRKGVPVAYIGDVRIRLRPDADQVLNLDGPHPRAAERFEHDAARWQQLWSEWTALGLSPEALFVYSWNPRLRNTIDPFTPAGQRVLRIASSTFIDRVSSRERRFVHHLTHFYGPEANPLLSDSAESLIGGG